MFLPNPAARLPPAPAAKPKLLNRFCAILAPALVVGGARLPGGSMRKAFVWCWLLFIVCGIVPSWSADDAPPPDTKAAIPWPAGLPVYDHVVIVIEENKDYEQIIDNPNAPYLNALREEGANL